MNVLENYQVRFVKDERGAKSMDSVNDLLDAYLLYYTSKESLEVLINACNYSVSGGEEVTFMEAHDLYIAEIGPLDTKIYRDIDIWGAGGAEPDFELPTEHFREIVLAWSNFIETE